jgi:hypothetical protein
MSPMQKYLIGLCILLSLVGLFLRADYKLNSNPSWLDEEFQVRHTQGPLKAFWQWHYYGETTCFPGDYLLTYPFVELGHGNLWIVRIPHILATILGFWLLYLVGRYYLRTIWGFAIIFGLTALNSSLVEHSFEIRPYAVLPTLGLLSLYCAHRIFDQERPLTFKNKIYIGLAYTFIGFFHAYGLFIMLLPLAYCFLRSFGLKELKEGLLKYGATLALTLLPGLAIWGWYMYGSNVVLIHLLNMNTFQYIPHPFINPVGFLKGILGNLVGFKPFYVLLLGAAALFLLRKKELWNRVGFLLLLVIVPIECVAVSSIVKKYFFLQRQFVWVIPFFAIWIAWQWETIISFLRGNLSRH